MTSPRSDGRVRRAAALPALASALVLVLGVAVFMQRSDEPDRIATAVEPEATPTVAPTTTSPPFVSETSATTPSAAPPTTKPAPATTGPAPSTTRAPAPTTAEATTTTTEPVDTLPEQTTQPIAPPADPRGYEDQIQLGEISIPKLGVREPLLEGIRLTTLDNGPGHWPGTAMPGEVGNVVVAAHRTSHGAPFRHIDQLVEGDKVEFTTADGVIEYTVTGTQIVTPDAVWIVNPTDTPTATLFACHPPGSVAYRYVVNLELS